MVEVGIKVINIIVIIADIWYNDKIMLMEI